jgi:hypothetical protein
LFRLTGELTNYNFLRTARRLDITTRLSKIGIGDPSGGLKDLCPQAKSDPFSKKLNYYLGATLRQPVFSGLRALPTITLFSERVSEYNAYLRTTSIGGIASVDVRRFRRTPITFAYSMDLEERKRSLRCSARCSTFARRKTAAACSRLSVWPWSARLSRTTGRTTFFTDRRIAVAHGAATCIAGDFLRHFIALQQAAR